MDVSDIVAPATSASRTTMFSGSSLPAGMLVEARVQRILADGLTILASVRGPIEVRGAPPLPIGTVVTVTRPEGSETVMLSMMPSTVSPMPSMLSEGVQHDFRHARHGELRPGSVSTPTSPGTDAATVPRMAPDAPLFGTLSRALARQDGVAPLMANLAALAEPQVLATLPAPLRQAIGQVLAARLVPDADGPTPRALAEAVEAAAPHLAPPLPLASGQTATVTATARPTSLPDALQRLAQVLAGLAAPPPEGEASADPTKPNPLRPEPPRRGGEPQPQKAAAATLAPGAGLDEITRTLAEQTEAARARVALAQLASLAEDKAPQRAEQPQPQMHLEIPIALGRETAMLGLRIDHEGGHGAGADGEGGRIWRLWLALDVEPAGPVRALVTLGGGTGGLGVTFWAERATTAERLARMLPDLRAELAAADLPVHDLASRVGAPKAKPVARSHFLDTTT